MVSKVRVELLLKAAALAGLAALAGCAAEVFPPPPPPPPRPVVVTPPRPFPPDGAPANLVLPAIDALGKRQTVNANISTAQTLWNFRSAYNVAALNCVQPQHASILEGYRVFLKTHAKKLTATNREIDREFRRKYRAGFVAHRDSYMTQVYNYFAFPPTLRAFCDTAAAMSLETGAVPKDGIDAYAQSSLVRFEAVFEDFYQRFERYKMDLAAWDARYAGMGLTAQRAPAVTPVVVPGTVVPQTYVPPSATAPAPPPGPAAAADPVPTPASPAPR